MTVYINFFLKSNNNAGHTLENGDVDLLNISWLVMNVLWFHKS